MAKAFYIATKTFREQPLKCWKFIIGMAKDNNIFTKLKSNVLDVDDDYVDDNDDYDDDDVDDVDDDGDDDDENDVYDDYDDKVKKHYNEPNYIINRKSILKDLKKKKLKVNAVLLSITIEIKNYIICLLFFFISIESNRMENQ